MRVNRFLLGTLSALLFMAMQPVYAQDVSEETLSESEETVPEESMGTWTPIDPVTVLDTEDFSITLTGIDPEDILSYMVSVHLENHTEEQVIFYSELAAINGIDVPVIFGEYVDAGEQADVGMYFADLDLQENEVGEYTDLLLNFQVYGLTEEGELELYEEASTHLYPLGEENASIYERELKESDELLIDDDLVSVVLTDYTVNDSSEFEVHFYLVNKTEQPVYFETSDIQLNGTELDPIWGMRVMPGHSAFGSMLWYPERLLSAGLTSIEKLQFSIYGYRYDLSDSYIPSKEAEFEASVSETFDEPIDLNNSSSL